LQLQQKDEFDEENVPLEQLLHILAAKALLKYPG
jgi:hypothetical protein